MSARGPIGAALVVAAVAVSVPACSSAPSGEATTASVVCGALRDVDNRVIDDVNDSVAGIAEKDPADRLPAILAGADAIEQDLQDWDHTIDGLALADLDEVPELRRGLHGGVVGALAELRDQRRSFEAGERVVTDEEVQGVVGIWFNAVEKVQSVLEPEIFRFDRRDFKQAFLDEAGCRNVVQQFVND